MIAAISGGAIIHLLIVVVVAFCIFLIVQWALSQFKLLEPFATIVKVILVLLISVFCIDALLDLTGHGFIAW